MENIENVGSWQQLFIPTCTDRIKNAKKRVLTSMEICLERARAQMKVMKEHGSEPMVIQRALMFKTYLEEKTIFIQDGELIIGNITSKVRGGSFAAEMVDFMDAELGHPEKDFEIRPHEKFIITPEERKELREEIIPFFKGNTLGDYILRRADEDVVRKAYSVTAEDPHIPVIGDLSLYKDLGHQMVNYEKVLYKGLKGVREEIVRYMEELEQPYTRYGRESKRDFYHSLREALLKARREHGRVRAGRSAQTGARAYSAHLRQSAREPRRGLVGGAAVAVDDTPRRPLRDIQRRKLPRPL
jgi:formate C-acetyltransferase